ncbi:MAG: MoxR family ATPase, partial [Pseudomonadota bacterium]
RRHRGTPRPTYRGTWTGKRRAATHAIYEWNYQRQLLAIRAAAEGGEAGPAVEARLFSETYLMERPLLAALRCKKPAVLLIDEVDRSDEEFEAYLLEILSDFQVTIPELGTIRATTRPHVILTANGTRDLSDALRRRCIYAYVDFPDRATELAILKARLPDLDGRLAGQVARFMALLRKEELQKTPGVAEMLDFAAALSGFGVNDITAEPAALQAALCAVLKTREDAARVPRAVSERLASKAA